MPDFRLPTTRTGRGPRPTCICGDCVKCKARERQRRFYDRLRERGYSSETDEFSEIDQEDDERVCFEHDINYSLKVGCPLCKEQKDGF